MDRWREAWPRVAWLVGLWIWLGWPGIGDAGGGFPLEPFQVRGDLRSPGAPTLLERSAPERFPAELLGDDTASWRWQPPEAPETTGGEWRLLSFHRAHLTVSRYLYRDNGLDPRGTGGPDLLSVLHFLPLVMQNPLKRKTWETVGEVFQPQLHLQIAF